MRHLPDLLQGPRRPDSKRKHYLATSHIVCVCTRICLLALIILGGWWWLYVFVPHASATLSARAGGGGMLLHDPSIPHFHGERVGVWSRVARPFRSTTAYRRPHLRRGTACVRAAAPRHCAAPGGTAAPSRSASTRHLPRPRQPFLGYLVCLRSLSCALGSRLAGLPCCISAAHTS
jgi:hypothetical protein